MFESLGILPPPLGPSTLLCNPVKIRVAMEHRFALPTPLIAYDLPWFSMSVEKSRRTLDYLDGIGIAVAGLNADFSETDSDAPTAHLPSPTICPYRPERYGLNYHDLSQAKWIDVRLVHRRDAIGLATYSTHEMRRWHRRSPIEAGIPAMGWPPDVASRVKLATKIEQLRSINPKAIVSVSIDAVQVLDNLDLVRQSPIDVLGVVARDWPIDQPDALVGLICRVGDELAQLNRELVEKKDRPTVKLMIVPPPVITVSDVVKLFALGARLVAVDGWCRELVGLQEKRINAAQWAAINLGVQSVDLEEAEKAGDFEPFENRLALFRTSLNSTGISDIDEMNRGNLVSFSQAVPGLRHASKV